MLASPCCSRVSWCASIYGRVAVSRGDMEILSLSGLVEMMCCMITSLYSTRDEATQALSLDLLSFSFVGFSAQSLTGVLFYRLVLLLLIYLNVLRQYPYYDEQQRERDSRVWHARKLLEPLCIVF